MRPQAFRRGVPAAVWAAVLWLLVTAAAAQTGDGYDLSWNTLDGGGAATGRGDDFAVAGTIAQPDAGTVTDGDYTVTGGFWAGVLGGSIVTCGGDCGGNGTITIDEIVLGVTIALGSQPLDRCPSFDANGDGEVTVDELIQAVHNALNGCP